MTFLQPFILWGLPLVLLPVLIHFLNRMRHRPQPWAAMRFLVSATRASVSHAKLRQWLILLFRVLAVLLLLLFLSRPLAGGWLGWVLTPAPDVIVMLLDRSPSMETQLPGTTTTRREQALSLLEQSARDYEATSHLVLIDSALRSPQELAGADSLESISLTHPSDVAADIPALFYSAVNWLVDNQAGTAEIWVASDLQRSNWKPEDPRWESVIAQLESLPQTVRVRLLALAQPNEANTSISLQETRRRQQRGRDELQFVLDFQRQSTEAESTPLNLVLNGARSQLELTLEGQAFRWRHQEPLDNQTGNGWGRFQLPADGNASDNRAYFVYGAPTPLRATVVAPPESQLAYLRHAAAGFVQDERQPAERSTPESFAEAAWEDLSLLVWQGPLPETDKAERIQTFVEEGGAAIFFPSGETGERRFYGTGWGEIQTAEAVSKSGSGGASDTGDRFQIGRWDEDQGPLATTEEGYSLPLRQLQFQRRQVINGNPNILAAFADGSPFLTRQRLGRGDVYFCATRAEPEWSTLGNGPVLVPMLQRLLQAGSLRLQQADFLVCGELSAVDRNRQWETVDSAEEKNIRVEAGVYRSGDRLIAVNRSEGEDEPAQITAEATEALFGSLSFQMFQEDRETTEPLQGEVWRFFLFLMLLMLLGEALLILPAPSQRTAAGGTAQPIPEVR